MQLQDTVNLLGLQGVRAVSYRYEIEEESSKAIIQAEPRNYNQQCPCCTSKETIRNGVSGYRRIRHLDIATMQCVLEAVQQRYKCKECGATYTHEYAFVSGKSRYSKAYKASLYRMSVGSTVRHGAEITETPYSTA